MLFCANCGQALDDKQPCCPKCNTLVIPNMMWQFAEHRQPYDGSLMPPDFDVYTKRYGMNWFFSDRGFRAYQSIPSLPEKIIFFQKFLHAVSLLKDTQAIYKIAFIMADAMDFPPLPWAGYPNILKNPLAYYLVHADRDAVITAADLLCALHGGDDPKKYEIDLTDEDTLKVLTPYSPENAMMYLIEREIIWLFPQKTEPNKIAEICMNGIRENVD